MDETSPMYVALSKMAAKFDPARNRFTNPSELSDVALVVEGRKLHVSKNVLSLASPVFQRMFYGNFKEKTQEEVSLPGKKFEDVLELLLCIYPLSEKQVEMYNLDILLPLAQEYQINALTKRCEKYILQLLKKNNLDMETAVRLLYLSDRYELPDSVEIGKEVAKDWNYEKLSTAKDFDSIDAETRLDVARKQISQCSASLKEVLVVNENAQSFVRVINQRHGTSLSPSSSKWFKKLGVTLSSFNYRKARTLCE